MVLFVLKAHGSLHFRGTINENAQSVVGQGVVIAAGADVFELAGLVKVALGVNAIEKEALDFVGGVQSVALLLEQACAIGLQDGAEIGGVGLSVFVNHFAEDQHFSGAKDVGRPPVKSGPIDPETQIALMLRGKPANGRTVKGKVVPTFDEKLLVIIEHVQAAFQIAEKHRHGFDSFLLRQILQALFPHLLDGYSLHPLFLGCQVQVFQFAVGKFQVVL